MAELSREDADRLRKLGQLWIVRPHTVSREQVRELAELAISVGDAICGDKSEPPKGDFEEDPCEECGQRQVVSDGSGKKCMNCGSTVGMI